MQSSLADMGIQTRSMTTEETIDFLAGNATYDDVRPRSGFLADDYRVATNRLSAPAAQRAIDSYRALVSKPEIDSNGNPIVDASGNPVMRDRTAEIKASLAPRVGNLCGSGRQPLGGWLPRLPREPRAQREHDGSAGPQRPQRGS
jgi:hypothetical protein